MKLKQANFYSKLNNGDVRCELCNHFCVIRDGEVGFCGVRKNMEGELYSLVYGRPVAINVDPIEKKPLFHFMPGTKTFSVGTFGCSFHCKNCLNHDISQEREVEKMNKGIKYISPEEIIDKAIKAGCKSISYTFIEPTIFAEYAIDIMKLAHKKGLKNVWVSNGFMTRECLDIIIPFLDAINVDLKSFNESFYNEICEAKLEPVLENLKYIKSKGVHLEVTTLVISGLSSDEEMLKKIANFILDNLGEETPWHISRFSPEISWKMKTLPQASYEELERAYLAGKNAGLKYVYSGNVIGDPKENTHCLKCDKILIERVFYNTKRNDKNGRCPDCDFALEIVD